ncbi:unnamed protein product, partial [marine sediment metagenome]
MGTKGVAMARTLHRLTDKFVRQVSIPRHYADGGNLYLQVTASGAKSWVFRFFSKPKRRTRDMGLGSLHAVSLTEARARAAGCRALVARGIDPIEQRNLDSKQRGETEQKDEPALPSGATFAEFAEQYIKERAIHWRSQKHAGQWLSTLQAYAFPIIGNMPLDAIDTPDVLRILEPIWPT